MSIWKYALVCAVTSLLLYFAGTQLPASFGLTNPDMPVLIVILNALMAFGLYAFLSRPAEPAVFMNLFLMTLVVKMLFAVGFMVVLAFLSPDYMEGNVVFSFICYLLFTFLETVILFRAKKQA